jgi:mRNA (guanine-N7-)-methyltransferase
MKTAKNKIELKKDFYYLVIIRMKNKDWQKQRQQSYFYNMRKFHNAIKRDLYNKYANSKSVLEVSFGKGGDYGKLFDNSVTRVVGYDIDANSIAEANRRLLEYPIEFQNAVSLHVLDLSTNIIPGAQDFDIVSCQFALHYFFKSEDTFLTILSSIENNLKVGGIFMGTFFDGKSLEERLKFPFDDPHFKLTRKATTETLFGNTINVSLKDDINISSAEIYNPEDEYIVDFEKFTKVMELLGFKLVESVLFNEIDSSKFRLKNTEKDVSFLNRTFVFRRLADINQDLEKVHHHHKL